VGFHVRLLKLIMIMNISLGDLCVFFIFQYSLSRRVSEPDIAVRDAMRTLKGLCERVANQKLLVMRSLEDDCGKQELNCQIAVSFNRCKLFLRSRIPV